MCSRLFFVFIILAFSGCSSTTVLNDLSVPYSADLEQIDPMDKLIPKSLALDIVSELTTSSWAEKPWVYNTNIYRRSDEQINLEYQNLVIVTPQIIREKKISDFFGGTRKYIRFKISLLNYEFEKTISSSDIEEAKIELKDKLKKCIYIVGRRGEIKTVYYGIKELCTNTQHDRRRLMKALIALGANRPPTELEIQN